MGEPRNKRHTLTVMYPGRCRTCHAYIEAGETVYWFPDSRKLQHTTCATSRAQRAAEGRSKTWRHRTGGLYHPPPN